MHHELAYSAIRSKHKGTLVGLRIVIRVDDNKQSGHSALTHGKAVFKVTSMGLVKATCPSYPVFLAANHRFMEILAAEHKSITLSDISTLDCPVTATASYHFNAIELDQQALQFPSTLPLYTQDCTRYPKLGRTDIELAGGQGSIRCTIMANNDVYVTIITNPDSQAGILRTLVEHLCEPQVSSL